MTRSNCCASFTLRIVVDAELYLRQAGERLLLEHEHDVPLEESLVAAACALVAVGAITAEAAQAVVLEYRWAVEYRDGEELFRFAAPLRAQPAPPGPRRLRLATCRRVIPQAWGRLETDYLVLREDSTSLRVTLRQPERTFHLVRDFPSGMPWDIPGGMPALTDDRGTRAATHFSGGGTFADCAGVLTTKPPLAVDTAWIEILGQRLDLTGGPVQATVWTEPVTEQDPARRYLWALAAIANDGTPLDPAVEALTAAGGLAADDPVIRQVRSAAEGTASDDLPGPWRSVLTAADRSDGPAGVVLVGATTPEFDSLTATVLVLESGPEGFSVDAEITPGIAEREVETRPLSWWAADDRGHYYHGQTESWGASLEGSHGRLAFTPPLDPQARTLDIMPTTATARGVIRIPLDWSR
jgi:hypothetical protein